MVFSKSIINERKKKIAEQASKLLKRDEGLLVFAGDPVQKPGGLDQNWPYIPHPDYFWLTGNLRAEGVIAFLPQEGWIEFVKPVSLDEKIWEHAPDMSQDHEPYRELGDFASWFSSRSHLKFHIFGKLPSSRVEGHGKVYGAVRKAIDNILIPESESTRLLREAFNEVRRRKDSAEIDLIKRIAGMAAKGYERVRAVLANEITERELQIEYEAAVLKAGAERMPYDSIVGSGTNSAILHALPTNRVIEKGDLVLIDAGADVAHYCVDITRVFVAGRMPSERQAKIISIVQEAQNQALNHCRNGIEWREVHIAAARVIAEGLRDLKILLGSVDEAIDTGSVSAFFPHGVGHMVGLQVRDVGGIYNPHPHRYAGSSIRVDMPIREGYVMTVEPGLYFIKELLNSSKVRSQYKAQIDFAEAEKWFDFGGVRLEDDVLITSKGPEILTGTIPKIL